MNENVRVLKKQVHLALLTSLIYWRVCLVTLESRKMYSHQYISLRQTYAQLSVPAALLRQQVAQFLLNL
jgi:hypothetical protein